MLKIGITGGIGSGKSTVCKVFELLGIPVYYSDWEAKNIQETDVEVKTAIGKEFGKNILTTAGTIDRTRLAAIVFNDKTKLQKLNNIVHPAVAKHFDNWVTSNQTANYVLKEAAILFESGAYKTVDKIISIIAPIEMRINRIERRDNISKDLVKQRMIHQMSDEEKIKRSDFVIYNDEQQLLIEQIISVHEQLNRL
jgi:dephospho-CoA kinase